MDNQSQMEAGSFHSGGGSNPHEPMGEGLGGLRLKLTQ